MRVLISGAGIAGATLAYFLAKAGARVTVVEKARSLLPHGQNVDIQGAALAVIKKMGLMDQLREHNTREKGTQFIDPNGRPFAPMPVKEGPGVSFTSQFEILRGDLAAILHRATKDNPNIKYVFGTTVNQVVSNDDNIVKVEFDNGETQGFDVLVAADGQWSKVRKQCFPSESAQAVHKGMYVVYYTIPRLSIDNDWWNIYLALGSRIVTTRPDPHGTIRAMFTIMPRNDTQAKAWREASRSGRQAQQSLLKSEFADAGWQTQRLLDNAGQAPDFYFQVLDQIKMSKWSNSRVICLGDTAFAPTPLTGMGTSMAITGAYVLAGELSKLDDGEHPSKAFEAYETAYRPFVEESQKIPFVLPSIAHPATATKRWLVHCFCSAMSRIIAIDRLAAKFGDESAEDDYPLEEYPKFSDKGLD